MNARGSGVVSGERRDLTKSVEGFSKPGEGKSRSSGRKFKKRGSEIQVSFFRKSSLFKRARGQIQIARLREGMAKDCNASAPKRVHAPPLSNLQGAWKEFKIRGKEIKTSRNKFKVRRNEIQIRRNEIQISLPSMNLAFSIAYRRLWPGGPQARRQRSTVIATSGAPPVLLDRHAASRLAMTESGLCPLKHPTEPCLAVTLQAAFLFESPRGRRRRRAWTCEDAPPQRPARRIEPRLLRKGCPAIHARLALRPRSRPFWGTKSNDNTYLENRKHKSRGRVCLLAITHG